MKILFCGGGALGSHALLIGRSLGRSLDAAVELAVVDFDRVETGNLRSQWFVKPMVGKHKASALKLQLLNFHGVTLKDYPVRLTADNIGTLFDGVGLLVDTFDNAASRQLVQDHARSRGLPCVHAGLAAEGAFGVVRWDATFVVDHEDRPGQPTCAGGDHLPIITQVAAALVQSMSWWLQDQREVNWNVSPQQLEAF